MSEDEVATSGSSTAEPLPAVVVPSFLLDGDRGRLEEAVDGRAALVAGDDPVLERVPESWR
jgi:hypothetical protein